MIGPVKLDLVFFFIRASFVCGRKVKATRDGGFERRLISLIFAGWVPHDLIRRGLPLSSGGRAV
jgi:hypothetical protein